MVFKLDSELDTSTSDTEMGMKKHGGKASLFGKQESKARQKDFQSKFFKAKYQGVSSASKPSISAPSSTLKDKQLPLCRADEHLFMERLNMANDKLQKMKLGNLPLDEYDIPPPAVIDSSQPKHTTGSTSAKKAIKISKKECKGTDGEKNNRPKISIPTINQTSQQDGIHKIVNPPIDKHVAEISQKPEEQKPKSKPEHAYEIRTWTDVSGSFQVTASFISLTSVEPFLVYLLRTDGIKVSVPLSKLSRSDVVWIREQTGVKPPEGSSFISAASEKSKVKNKHRIPPPPPKNTSPLVSESSSLQEVQKEPSKLSADDSSCAIIKEKVPTTDLPQKSLLDSSKSQKHPVSIQPHRTPPLPPVLPTKISNASTPIFTPKKDDDNAQTKEENNDKYSILNKPLNKNEIDLNHITVDESLLKKIENIDSDLSLSNEHAISLSSIDVPKSEETVLKDCKNEPPQSRIDHNESLTISSIKEKIEEARNKKKGINPSSSLSILSPQSSQKSSASSLSSSKSALEAVFKDLNKKPGSSSSSFVTQTGIPATLSQSSSEHNSAQPYDESHRRNDITNPFSNDARRSYSALQPEQKRYSQPTYLNEGHAVRYSQSNPYVVEYRSSLPVSKTPHILSSNYYPPFRQVSSGQLSHHYEIGPFQGGPFPLPFVSNAPIISDGRSNILQNGPAIAHGASGANYEGYLPRTSSHVVETITYSDPSRRNTNSYQPVIFHDTGFFFWSAS